MNRSCKSLSTASYRRNALVFCCLVACGGLLLAADVEAQSLRGSTSSLDRQNRQARAHDFTYLADLPHVRRFTDAGLLVRLSGNKDYTLKDVSFPYARPEVRLFVERLSSQFRDACGEKLVVTSLTRPKANQPRNASQRSVHPTGMAVDLRRHNTSSCRKWLEAVLLSLEGSQVLEVSLEQHPPHYHIAVFPKPYANYVERITGTPLRTPRETGGFVDLVDYTVGRKDTLWHIARRHGTTPEQIQATNGLRSSKIFPGQRLRVPLAAEDRDR